MKKTITFLALLSFSILHSQNVADFETFTLPADSFYYDVTGTDFQTSNATFDYDWDTSFGGFWNAGFAYTNKKDSSNGGYMNLYNCIAYNGYNNSNYYVTGQANGVIKLKTTTDNIVNGFYITNTTYAYKSMASGDAIGKKFGGSTGNDPDWFKVTVKGYLGGIMKTDSAEFYLADFRSSNNSLDYIVKGWQWFDCSNIGVVDSIQFFMYSSDVGAFGMNTPAFFSLDNFTTSMGVGINEYAMFNNAHLFPNPANDKVNLTLQTNEAFYGNLRVINSIGIEVRKEQINLDAGTSSLHIELSHLSNGFYLVEFSNETKQQTFKVIKN